MAETAAPSEEAGVAEVVREAAAASRPLRLIGGGTRAGLGRPVQPAMALSMAAHRGVTLYDPGALTLVVRAGTPVAEIEALLASENQQLAFEPMDHRGLLGAEGEPTIGGVVAANVSGPRRVLAGACRDFVLGVRFVTGEGTVVKNGGRVMKNVTGLDLAKLMCGAYGTLGVLTEIALKVAPRPERALTLAFDGLGADQGVALLTRALGTPYEVSGAAFAGGRALLRIEGLESQAAHRAARLKALFADRAVEEVTGEAHDALWRGVRDVAAFQGDGAPVWRLSVRPTDAPALAARLEGELGAELQFDWGGGLLWVRTPAETAERLRAVAAPFGGHATLVRAPAALRAAIDVFQPEAPRVAQLSAALRRRFDPAGVLNPGLMAAA